MLHGGIGHNIGDAPVRVEVRLFNSLARFGGGRARRDLELPPGGTVGDVLARLGIPAGAVFLALCNGRDVTADLGGAVNTERVVEDGDVVALSGPVPYSWGYGAPVV